MNFNFIEKSASSVGVQAIKALEKMYGTEVLIYREKDFDSETMTPSKSVYGRYAGTSKEDDELQTDQVEKTKLLICGDPFHAHAESFDFGMPESVKAYSTYTDIQVGDSVVIARDDGRRLQLEVIARQGLGLTTNTVVRYELSPVSLPTHDAGVI